MRSNSGLCLTNKRMLRGGALPDVTGPAGSALWLWLNGIFTSGKSELIYSVRVVGGAPDIDPAGDELRKTSYSYENLYRAWRILKTCSTQYVDAAGTRYDSTLQLLVDNYVIDAYAHWNIDKLNRSAWLLSQVKIKDTNASGGADVISRPLCRPPPEGTPLALFDEYTASDKLLEKDAAQQKTIADLTIKLTAYEQELERLGAQVASHPAIMESHANERVTASLQSFQAQYAALQMQLAHVSKVKDENIKSFEATMAAERQSNEVALKGCQTRIADLQTTHADKLREIQTTVRAQLRKADEESQRTISDLQKASSIDRDRTQAALRAEFDRTLARHAEDLSTCNKRVTALTMQGKQDVATIQRECDGEVERAKQGLATCNQKLHQYTELFEREKANLVKMNTDERDESVRRMQDIVTRFDDMGNRSSCSIM